MAIFMKVCPNCKNQNREDAVFCVTCGADIAHAPQQEQAVMPPAPPQPTVVVQPSSPYAPVQPKPFSWSDICTIIGFIAAIIGLFWCSVVLLPIGIICCLIGFVGNRTRGLAVAGLAISLIASLIRVCIVLYQSGLIPDWVTQGVFF